jgi:hypothetical protein
MINARPYGNRSSFGMERMSEYESEKCLSKRCFASGKCGRTVLTNLEWHANRCMVWTAGPAVPMEPEGDVVIRKGLCK